MRAMLPKRIKLRLKSSHVKEVRQWDGTFTIVLNAYRKNRKGRLEFYDIELHDVNQHWLTRLLNLTQEKVAEYKDSVVKFASRFSV